MQGGRGGACRYYKSINLAWVVVTSRPTLQTNLEMFVGVLWPGLKACLCKSKRSGDYHSSTNASMTWPSAEPSSLRCLGGRAVGRPSCLMSLPLALSLYPSLLRSLPSSHACCPHLSSPCIPFIIFLICFFPYLSCPSFDLFSPSLREGHWGRGREGRGVPRRSVNR